MDNPLYAFSEEERAYLRETFETEQTHLSPYAARDEEAIYEQPSERSEDDRLVRPNFVQDVDLVLNNPYYNRCMDKTQVFPLYRNDDLTRRSFHLQLVAQISCKISRALHLNVPLTRAIALGHDMGHTPFGHGGERVLSNLYHAHTGRYFNHNVHSVRLIRTIAGSNISLQALNGMLCHCGEKAFAEYQPEPCESFAQLDAMMERCYTEAGASQTLRPSTLEGCVVRICDILAYLGKDRQDAITVGVLSDDNYRLEDNPLGSVNREFIGNATANIVKNSIGKPYLKMDEPVFEGLLAAKEMNSHQIYESEEAHERLDRVMEKMMGRLYERCRKDLIAYDAKSPIVRHHLKSWVIDERESYLAEPPDDIVVDYLASMTDDYMLALDRHLFPDEASKEGELYVPYFRD